MLLPARGSLNPGRGYAQSLMQRPPSAEQLRGPVEGLRLQRARGRRAVESARATRALARRLRQRSLAFRDAALAQRWHQWSAGLTPEPPTFIPTTWTGPRDTGAALDRAVRECRACASTLLGRRDAAVVTALCQLAELRLRARDDEAAILLSLTARTIDRIEPALGTDVESVLCAAACRRCAQACRTALVALYLERSATP